MWDTNYMLGACRKMRISSLVAIGLVPFLGGCHVAVLGNLLLLALSVGIFMGTLSLGTSSRD